jgi:hypothetical protein
VICHRILKKIPIATCSYAFSAAVNVIMLDCTCVFSDQYLALKRRYG